MLGASLIVGIILIATLTYFFKDQINDQNIEVSKEILVSIENELFLATKVESGYMRNFEIPGKLNNREYNISINNGNLILSYNGIEFIGNLPNMSGDILKGANIIRNIDGKVCLNLEMC
jgi:hypothetical protein